MYYPKRYQNRYICEKTLSILFKSMSNLEQQLYFNLGERDQRVLIPKDITNILNISQQHASNLVANMVKK